MFTQQTVKTIDTQKNIWEYTLEELHSVLGSFEKEYHEATTGKVIRNEILGYVHEGNVQHALGIGAIIKQGDSYFVKLPEYREYDLKLRVLGELIKRREYAKKQNDPQF